VSHTVFTPPEPRPLPAARLARRRTVLLAEIEAGRVRSSRRDVPGRWAEQPRARRRVVLVLAVLLLLGAVGTAVGVGIRLLTQEERFHELIEAQGGGPDRVGPIATVAEGDGWAFFAWRTKGGVCVDVAVPGRSATSCGPAPSGAGQTAVVVASELGPGALAVAGAVPAEAERVEVELAGAGAAEAEVYDAPSELGSGLRFFLFEAPAAAGAPGIGAVRAVRAYDGRGALLQSTPLNDTER
jgi:hypothetical protein